MIILFFILNFNFNISSTTLRQAQGDSRLCLRHAELVEAFLFRKNQSYSLRLYRRFYFNQKYVKELQPYLIFR